MSLRGRLLVASLALVALGVLAAEAATFVLLRSSLIGRIDDQLRGSGGFVAVRGPGPGLGFERPAPVGGGGFEVSKGRKESLPVPYVAFLDPNGVVTLFRSDPFGETPAPPTLPDDLPGSVAQRVDEESRLFTTGSTDGSVRYRVMAVGLPNDAGTAIVAYPLSEVDATLRRLLVVEGIVAVAVLAGVAALALWLVRLGLRPLTQMEETAAHIADGDLSRRVEPSDERTEIGRLGRALNAMLEKIEAAFAERRASEARLRRFVADASHELRTPLTSIRGYAELFRHGADERPEDLEKSMRRIEEESTRMSTLVDELLLLARLDQGRPLDRAPVDLAEVAADAVSDARAVQPERPISIQRNGPLVVEGDEMRLRQVAANLLANALEHTAADTPVRVRVGAQNGEAVLDIADEGPGLSEEDAAKVFDRFFRVDEARSRESGGAGLGLSIVAAIVRAHGGRVTLLSAPGKGARFVVALPLHAAVSRGADSGGTHSPSTIRDAEH